MSKSSLHLLAWSQADRLYQMYTDSILQYCCGLDETEALWDWLDACTSVSFQGQKGHLTLLKEMRTRGGGYWYAYAYRDQRKIKRYLGTTRKVILPSLEEIAAGFLNEQPTSIERSSAPAAPLPDALLLPKLSPPRLPAGLVMRERLLTRLDQALTHAFTLLSASAGSGKTTLLAAWTARARLCSHTVAWLALDDLNRDPTHFWVSLILALRSCWPHIGTVVLGMLHSPQSPPLSTILMVLLRELTERGEEITLILDDYQVIDDPSLHEALLFWLNHAPDSVHLILATRADPPFSLSRFRVRGQLLELRDTDLSFQQAESRQFLTEAMGLALSEEELLVLEQRTKGWIAGLQLAALAMRQREDRSAFVQTFTGSQSYVFDYVQEEIVAHLDAPVQDFLMHTSVLPRLHADLCQVVMATLDSPTCQELLERIERANLFLVPLDEERGWYRFHDLFREALLARLRATQPTRVLLLHTRAARWHEQRGETREAIVHLLAAQDFSSAVLLMERAAEEIWLQGESQILFHWVMALPNATLRKHARFALTAALYLLNATARSTGAQAKRARAQVERMMARVEETTLLTGKWEKEEQLRGDQELSAPEMALLRRRLRLLCLWSTVTPAEIHHDWEEQVLSTDQQLQREDQDDEMLWQMIPLSIAFLAHFTIRGEGALLLPRLLAAKQQASQSADRFVLMKIKQWLALTALQAARLRLAHQECLQALSLLEQWGGYDVLSGYFSLCLAYVFYEWNRLEEARGLLRKTIHDATSWQQVDLQTWCSLELAQLEIGAGNLTAADRVLQEISPRLHQATPFNRSLAVSLRVHWWLAQGNLAEASAWAARSVFRQDVSELDRSMELFALIRVYLAQQQYDQAIQTLQHWSQFLDRPGDIRLTISFLAFSLVALSHADKHQQARTVAIRLFTLTEPEDYLRVYLDLGELMRQSLEALLSFPRGEEARLSPLPRASIAHVLAAFERAESQRHLPTGVPYGEETQAPPDLIHRVAPTRALVEALSAREREVLQFLAAGASNQDIAYQLVISLNTVKKHVGNVLAKLGVQNRTQAVVRAREWSLL